MYLEEINKIFTCVTKEELKMLHDFAKNKEVCVEIGSYLGASSIAIASALKDDARVYCIDTWKSNPSMRPDPKNSMTLFENFAKNTKKYMKHISPIISYSSGAINLLKKINIEIDLLFIDGDHSREGVKQDWELYFPLLKKGGIAVFHDYASFPEVKKIIKEYVLPLTYNHDFLPNMWWGQKK